MIILGLILFVFIALGAFVVIALLAAGWAIRRSGARLPLAPMAAGGLAGLILFGLAAQVLLNRGLPQQWAAQVSRWYAYQTLPNRVVQVDLGAFQAISQYDSDIADMFGANGCGLIAPAQAEIGSQSGLANTPQNRAALAQRMEAIRVKAVRPDGRSSYGPVTGIQPAELAQALQASGYQVSVHNNWDLQAMYQAIADGKIVIVDIRINAEAEHPGTAPDTLSHYARLLGMDLDKQEIYLENTLTPANGAYWTLSMTDFLLVWQHPETQATIKPSQVDPSIKEEDVTQWAIAIEK